MRKKVVLGALGALVVSGCGMRCGHPGPGNQVPGEPLETASRQAPSQTPTFTGQTRAPFKTASVGFEAKRVLGDLEHPWGLAFLPDRSMLITERPGRLVLAGADGARANVVNLPKVDARDQGGLLDVVVDPKHADTGLIYWCYAEPRDGGNGTAVARGRLVREGAPRVEQVQVVWRMQPTFDSTKHFGSRLVFARDGTLFIATGERSDREARGRAQGLDNGFGKVIRIHPDGGVPKDNPFVGREGALPEIYSYGHRTIQSAALHPDTGKLWTVEHGARGGDEVNLIEPGKNYGWPVVAYGVEYSGSKIGEGKTEAPGMEQPLYYWDPVIAPSGMAFYTGDVFPAWRGSLFVGGLAAKHVARLTLEGTQVVGEERLLVGRARFRDVRQGPDGHIYLLTDESEGELLKLVPAATVSKPE